MLERLIIRVLVLLVAGMAAVPAQAETRFERVRKAVDSITHHGKRLEGSPYESIQGVRKGCEEVVAASTTWNLRVLVHADKDSIGALVRDLQNRVRDVTISITRCEEALQKGQGTSSAASEVQSRASRLASLYDRLVTETNARKKEFWEGERKYAALVEKQEGDVLKLLKQHEQLVNASNSKYALMNQRIEELEAATEKVLGTGRKVKECSMRFSKACEKLASDPKQLVAEFVKAQGQATDAARARTAALVKLRKAISEVEKLDGKFLKQSRSLFDRVNKSDFYPNLQKLRTFRACHEGIVAFIQAR